MGYPYCNFDESTKTLMFETYPNYVLTEKKKLNLMMPNPNLV